jgi:hypothetical protein
MKNPTNKIKAILFCMSHSVHMNANKDGLLSDPLGGFNVEDKWRAMKIQF